MGRFIFNQPLDQMIALWGVPNLQGETPITLNFPIDALRQQFPDFPPTGKLQITFIRNKVQRFSVFPEINPRSLFEFLFQYQAPTDITVAASSENTGLYNATICLGDGIGANIQMTGGGDNYTQLYYNEDFVAPYDLLVAQSHITRNFSHHEPEAEYSWLSERQVTESDLQGLYYTRIYTMWHSIYARKGLIFCNPALHRVFERQSWYRPRYRVAQFNAEVMPQLSSIEKSNLDFLKRYFLVLTKR